MDCLAAHTHLYLVDAQLFHLGRFAFTNRLRDSDRLRDFFRNEFTALDNPNGNAPKGHDHDFPAPNRAPDSIPGYQTPEQHESDKARPYWKMVIVKPSPSQIPLPRSRSGAAAQKTVFSNAGGDPWGDNAHGAS